MNVLVPIPFDLSSMMHGRNLRVVHVLRELNRRCDLTCVVPEHLADAARAVLRDVDVVAACPVLAMSFPSESYWLSRAMGFYGFDDALAADLVSRSLEADIVLGFGAGSAAYLWSVKQRSMLSRCRAVCDLIDDPYLTWRSMPRSERLTPAGLKALVCLQILRRRVLRSFDGLTSVAPRDAASLSRAAGRAVAVVPNGVEATDVPAAAREPLVVFTGRMDFPPNEAAACHLVHRIWPRVRKLLNRAGAACGSARLAIVGARPTRRVRALAEAPDVEVTGRVDDVGSWLSRAGVAAVPMVSGSGIKNKILEASATGCPVVTTPLGADGLPTGQDNGVLVADTPQRFAAQVADLLSDVEAASRVGKAGWTMVRRSYTWPAVSDRLWSIMQGSMSGQPVASPAGRQQAERMEAALNATS